MSLKSLLEPDHVAIVGASDREGSPGWRILRYLRETGYTGRISAVNPKGGVIQGIEASVSVRALAGDEVDHAVILVPAEHVPRVVTECNEAGIGSVSILASGFSDSDINGPRLQREIGRIADESGIRVLGPNCLGVVNMQSGFIGTVSSALMTARVEKGRVGIISQSGALGAYVLGMLGDRGLGISYFVSTGNEVDVKLGEVLRHLVVDDSTDVLAMYIEEVRDPENFAEAARLAAERGKRLVAIKGGQTSTGAEMVRSHTSALAGDAQVYSSLFEAYGVEEAQNLGELVELVEVGLSYGVTPRRPRTAAVITSSGGLAIVAADALAAEGILLPTPPADAQERMRDLIPFCTPTNPIDLTGQIANETDKFPLFLEELVSSSDFDLMVAIMSNIARSPLAEPAMTRALADAAQGFEGRMIVVGPLPDPSRALLQNAGVLVCLDPGRVGQLATAFSGIQLPQLPGLRLPPRAPTSFGSRLKQLDYGRSVGLLRVFGIPVPASHVLEVDEVTNPGDAVGVVGELGFPVVVKGLVSDVAHKTELGLVFLDVGDDRELSEAVSKIWSSHGQCAIAIEEYVQDVDYEMLLDTRWDPTWGLVATIGLGGVFAEVLGEVAALFPPITPDAVEKAIKSLRGGSELLAGFRGRPSLPVGPIAEILVRLIQVLEENPQISEIEINPLAVSRSRGPIVLDVLVVHEDEPDAERWGSPLFEETSVP